ncbi:ABC transporter permease [Aquimarina algicola]|uniref:FtsX-like permease family protein n=1 Tax=Aquimarina algicola TaxID=2589995 RepID=A0A504JNS2_9FLAO|nr:ABC transporter permease [Aquimarina algicola]TPN88020.1 FtsX-like permease family protein [Aquimarina algicola]
MYTLYFKIAVRYLFKNKLYSFINILGLAIGVTSFILIMVYVNYERSFDRFRGSENVYRVYMDYLEGDQYVPGDAQSYNAIGPAFANEFPEVLDYVRFYRFGETVLQHNDKFFEVNNGNLADHSYFKVFDKRLIKGDINTALLQPNSIVLTETLAQKIFGDQDPIGKTITMFYTKPLVTTVTGVMKDIAENTHFKIKYLISFDTMKSWEGFPSQPRLNWNLNEYFTYLHIDPKTDIAVLQDKIINSNFESNSEERHNIEPIEDIHLYSNKPYEAEANGSIMRVKFLTAIAFIIIILSWLNYINLSTTKSMERSKEIGIRKVSGAQKRQLILQSLLESFILNLLAIGIAILIAVLIIPLYNSLTGHVLELDSAIVFRILPILGILLLGILIVGLYPAIILSNYSPSKALKGKIRASANGLNVRKGLIILQFLATIVLLVGTLVVNKQIRFMQDQPIGSDLNNIIAISGTLLENKTDSLLVDDMLTLQQEVNKLPFVKSATIAQTYPGGGFEGLSSFMGITRPDGVEEQHNVYYNYDVQPNFFEVMGIEFRAGNTFTSTSKSNDNKNIIVNENFIKKIEAKGAQEAIGKKVKFWDNEWTIIGVIKNYHHFGVKMPTVPIIFINGFDISNLLIKLDANSTSISGYNDIIADLKRTSKKTFSNSIFKTTFIDKEFQAQYQEDKKFGDVFNIFTLLAIIIAGLGLFGLTSYTCIQRRKEIGIRKVNGASVFKILKLLNIDFIKWIGLAFLLAIPIAWYSMNTWLENFAVRTTIGVWTYISAGFIALLITLLTVSWQSFKAATDNPVKALKDD